MLYLFLHKVQSLATHCGCMVRALVGMRDEPVNGDGFHGHEEGRGKAQAVLVHTRTDPSSQGQCVSERRKCRAAMHAAAHKCKRRRVERVKNQSVLAVIVRERVHPPLGLRGRRPYLEAQVVGAHVLVHLRH